MTQEVHIELWYDETSDETPSHIVSLGDAQGSRTLAAFPPDTDGYSAALARAMQEAKNRGLSLLEEGVLGVPSP